jgi:hypothetical protein
MKHKDDGLAFCMACTRNPDSRRRSHVLSDDLYLQDLLVYLRVLCNSPSVVERSALANR